MPIRVGVSAALVRNNKILLIEFNDENGLHYNFPGGGVEPGECVKTALRRELFEETAAIAEVGKLLGVWEYFPEKHAQAFGSVHKVNLVFECSLSAESPEPTLPAKPDPHQTGVKWVALNELEQIQLLPKIPEILQNLRHLTVPAFSELG